MYFRDFNKAQNALPPLHERVIVSAKDCLFFAANGFSKPVMETEVNLGPTLVDEKLLQISDGNIAPVQYWVQRLERHLGDILDNPDAASDVQKRAIRQAVDALLTLGTNEACDTHQIDGLDFDVRLDSTSLLAQELAVTMFRNSSAVILTEGAIHYWEETVRHALRLIERHAPNALPHIKQTLKWIVPVHCHTANMSLSGTPESCHHIFAASWVPAKNFAETIIHECAHGALNEIMQTSPLIEKPEALHYSPFRTDLRPTDGLLHAQYSFHNICLLLADMRRDNGRVGDWAKDMLPAYLFNTYLCFHNLQQANALTSDGTRLSVEMNEDILALKSEMGERFHRELGDEKQADFDKWCAGKDDQSDFARHKEQFKRAQSVLRFA